MSIKNEPLQENDNITDNIANKCLVRISQETFFCCVLESIVASFFLFFFFFFFKFYFIFWDDAFAKRVRLATRTREVALGIKILGTIR